MQLTGENLTCERGGREVFRGLSFSLKSGEALLVTGRNGAGKSSLLRMIAGLVRIAAGTLAIEGGEPEAPIGEQAHYLGHLDALKPALTVAENLQFWAEFLGPASGDVDARAGRGRSWPRSPICRRRICRPGNGGGCRSRAWSRCRARSGCSTSRPRRSMPPRRRGSPT